MPQPEIHPDQSSGAPLAEPLLEIIETLVSEVRPGSAAASLTLDSSFERQLGLDSLSRVELIHRVERHFSLSLPDQVFAEAETPRDLLRELGRTGARSDGRGRPNSRRQRTRHLVASPDNAETLVEMLEWHVREHPSP